MTRLIELYDVGRCTHKPVKGMYEFIVDRADKFVSDPVLAKELQNHAVNREKQGYSIPQEAFSEMCRIWVTAYRSGDFPIDVADLTFPDTVTRFQYLKKWNQRQIGILTSGSKEFTEILYGLKVESDKKLSDFVDEYFLGEEIGDKDRPETFARLWDKTEGRISAIYDDKISVCEAAVQGLGRELGRRWTQSTSLKDCVWIWLVDRKNEYATADGELRERVQKLLQDPRVHRVNNFDQVTDFEIGGDE